MNAMDKLGHRITGSKLTGMENIKIMNPMKIYSNIPGWSSNTKLILFARLARFYQETTNGLRILEIGSWLGRSLLTWADNAPEAEVTSVDIRVQSSLRDQISREPDNPKWNSLKGDLEQHRDIVELPYHDALKKVVEDSGFQNIRLHDGGSDEFFKGSKSTIKFNLIFIDGDHAKEQFEKDLFKSIGRLAPQGLILCDDISWDGLPEVVADMCRRFRLNSIYLSSIDCMVIYRDTTDIYPLHKIIFDL